MTFPTNTHAYYPPPPPPGFPPSQVGGAPIPQHYGQPTPAPGLGSSFGQIDKITPVHFPSASAASGFAVQRQTTSGPKYFPTDSTDPATAQRFDSFAAARKARDEHSDLWRFNGQIVEASALLQLGVWYAVQA